MKIEVTAFTDNTDKLCAYEIPGSALDIGQIKVEIPGSALDIGQIKGTHH